jgi:phosphoribosylformylglycinamidine synthase
VFPRFDLAAERRLGELLRVLAARRLLRSAQDVADGGLAVALAECALLGECGVTVQVDGISLDVALFSEDQGRAVVTCARSDVDTVLALAAEHVVPAFVAGQTGGDVLAIAGAVEVSLARMRDAWEPES